MSKQKFITFSTLPEDFDRLSVWVLAWAESPIVRVVAKQYGKQGDHPHYHCVINDERKQTYSVTRTYTNIFKNIGITVAIVNKDNKTIRTKHVYSVPGIVEYINRESAREILINKDNIDFTIKNVKYNKYKWSFVPTYINFPLFFKEFYEEHFPNREYVDPYFHEVIKLMHVANIPTHHVSHRYDSLRNIISDIME